MRVVALVDPVALEDELLERVRRAHAGGQATGTLVLVPTARLAEHVLRRLGEARPAWLGLEVLHFRALGLRVLERETGSTRTIASPLVLEAIVRRLLEQHPRNAWSGVVRRRPGALRRLVGALADLREAGIDPKAVAEYGAGDERDRGLAELFAAYHEALERRSDSGWTDDAGLMRAARPHAAAFGRRIGAVFLHGAYELLGIHLDLLRELDRTSDVTALVPVRPGAPVTAYAEEFAREFLLDANTEPESAVVEADAGRARRLAALYDEEQHPAPAASGTFTVRHAQGAAAEVKFAVRQALCAVRDGCPPTEIAITARTLEPYAAAIEEALEDAGLPWTSSLGSPLRRHPVVRDFLLLLQVVADGFPREATVELLRSRRVRWKVLGSVAAPRADLADDWSRRAKIIAGLDEWTADLAAWATEPRVYKGQDEASRARAVERAPQDAEWAGEIGAALSALDRAVVRSDARWSEHAANLRELLESMLHDPDEGPAAEARDRLGEIVEDMAQLERVAGDVRDVPFEEMRSWLESAVDGDRLTLRRRDDGGIRVLDAMQLRGLTFRRLHLMGMNGGQFPRPPREDAILDDDLRRALRERTGRPLGIKSRGTAEEHLLLALLLGSARERTEVSWQRADESGRAKSVSLALREVARVSTGRPDFGALRDGARHLPSHPTHWLEEVVASTGLLAPGEEQLLAALSSRDAEAASALERRFPDLAPGLEMLRATQSFTPVRDEYDARIGPLEPAAHSVSALEQLGECPLRYFFQNVLRVGELEDPASAYDVAAKERGNVVHALLESIYRDLHEEGLFDPGRSATLVRRGLELLAERRDRVLGPIQAKLERRLPVLWGFLADRWLRELRRVVEEDLERIRAGSLMPGTFETLISATLDFGKGVVESVRGKFDRCLEGEAGSVVSDYKTSKSLEWRVDKTKMLRGQTLQVPLYRLLAGGDAAVELLGIHPDLDPDDRRRVFDGFDTDAQTTSFSQTMRVLYGLRNGGSFPFRKDRHCGWCPYTEACRRLHPPTQDREYQRPDGRGYRDVQRKTKTMKRSGRG